MWTCPSYYLNHWCEELMLIKIIRVKLIIIMMIIIIIIIMESSGWSISWALGWITLSKLGGFQVGGSTNSESNPELFVDLLWDGNSEYPVPEQLIWISSTNSEYVHFDHQWSPDTLSHHGNYWENKLELRNLTVTGAPPAGLWWIWTYISLKVTPLQTLRREKQHGRKLVPESMLKF